MSDKEKRLRLIRQTAIWAAVLAGYYIFTRLTGLSIPCLFHEITGLKCPGCGATHMATYMAQFRFKAAFHANPLLFFMIPLLLLMLAVKIIFLPPQLEAGSRVLTGIMSVFIVLLVVFGVVRNFIGI